MLGKLQYMQMNCQCADLVPGKKKKKEKKKENNNNNNNNNNNV